MRMLVRYIRLECKETGKVIKSMAAGIGMMVLLLAALVFAVGFLLQKATAVSLAEIGVVIPSGQKDTRLAVQFISSMNSVKSIGRFSYLSETEAIQELKQDKLQAVIVLPEDFYNKVENGINDPIMVYFPSSMPQRTKIFKELLADGISFVKTGEAGVYASMKTAEYYQAQVDRSQIGDVVAKVFTSKILWRGGMFQNETYAAWGNVDLFSYYFSTFLVCFLLMSGVCCGFLYREQSRAVAQRLQMYGMGKGMIFGAKIVVMTLFLWTLAVGIYAVACAGDAWFGNGSILFHIRSVFFMLLGCLGMASYFHCFYSLSGGGIQAAVVLIAVNVLMALASGTILPTHYLPEGLQGAHLAMPLYYWNQYWLGLMFGGIGIGSVLQQVVICLAGVGLGAVLSWKNI